jgi:hypothetical protein
VAELEGVRLMDTLHLGAYWPVREGEDRRRRPPSRLGVEQERGFWEERLPREPSMGDPSSRQRTPQSSPQPSPLASHLNQSTDGLNFDYQQLPTDFHHFCPDWAGEEEPDQMEEVRLGTE